MKQHKSKEQSATLLDHLNVLRVRLTWAFVGLVVATVVGFVLAEKVLALLIEPYGGLLQTLAPTEGVETYFKVALAVGVVLSMPFTLYQLWLFVAPGLEKRERRYVYLFVPFATILFLAGIAFAWLVLMPAAIFFLADFLPEIFAAEWTGREYISFTTTFLVWLGVSFEMPLIVYFLSRMGFVSSRGMRKQWRAAIVGIAVLAAAITPSIDPVTMLLTMLPLTLLYVLSILLAGVGARQFEKATSFDAPAD